MPIRTQKMQNSIGFSMVFGFLRSGPKSLIWRLLGLLAASILSSQFRRMLFSKNHINSQLILSKMRFWAVYFALKLAQNRACSSKQKTSLAAAKLIFCIFIDHKIDWNWMPLQGGYPGRPGPHPAPSVRYVEECMLFSVAAAWHPYGALEHCVPGDRRLR